MIRLAMHQDLRRQADYNGVVRLGLLFCLSLALYACYAADQLDLQKEDVQAIQHVLKKQDSSLDWFRVLAKKPVDTTHSVMVVEAAPTELRPSASKRSPIGSQMQIGSSWYPERTTRFG
jgi:hypothetical protein